jgi:hypothetical protein
MPIEGVLGAIEVNIGLNTGYAKLQKDAEKLDRIASLLPHRLSMLPVLQSHTPFPRGIDGLTAEDLQRDLCAEASGDLWRCLRNSSCCGVKYFSASWSRMVISSIA